MMPANASLEPRTVVIRPARGWVAIDWRELIQQRELLLFLILRDVKVRYKQTVLGVAWAVLQPVFTMLVFTVFFGRFANMPSQNLPYAVFVYAGLLPWLFVSTAIGQAALSLVNQQSLLTKVYLPRVFVPAAAIGGALVDLGVSLAVFVALMLFYGLIPGVGVLAVPGLLLLMLAMTLGISLILAALTVSYRDIRHVIPFLLQTWMFLSPVIYPVSFVPAKYRWLLALNPMTGIIDGFRAAFLDQPWPWDTIGVSAGVSVVCLVVGLYYFRRTERRFADVA